MGIFRKAIRDFVADNHTCSKKKHFGLTSNGVNLVCSQCLVDFYDLPQDVVNFLMAKWILGDKVELSSYPEE